jgi:hypothetical protein
MIEQKVERGWKVVKAAKVGPDASSVDLDGDPLLYSAMKSVSVRYGRFWTQPRERCGPLCVFRRKSDAVEWVGLFWHTRRLVVVPCWYVPSDQIIVWIEGVWCDHHTFPSGTVLADAVFLDLP